MKKHFTVSPKLTNKRRVTASTNNDDEILITNDFSDKLYDALMEHCNCSGSDADRVITNLYHRYLDKHMDRAQLVQYLVFGLYDAAIAQGVPPEDLQDWEAEAWDTVPIAIDDASQGII